MLNRPKNFLKDIYNGIYSPVWLYPVAVFLIGCALILLSIIWKSYIPSDSNWLILPQLLEIFGTAFFAMSVVTFILEFRDWKSYFEKILKRILEMDSYLSTLGKERLDALLSNVLKAYFKNSTLDQKGTFFWHFKDDLLKYISAPHRENVSAHIYMTLNPDGKIKIRDIISYDLVKNELCDFPSIKWAPDSNEFETVETIEIKVTPSNGEPQDYIPLSATDLNCPHEFKFKDNGNNIVRVKIESVYVIRESNFQYWQMTYPSRNLAFTAICPKEYEIRVKPFVMNETLIEVIDEVGSYNLKYTGWMLPKSGIAWSLKKKS